jgi:hypothetical protein
MVRLGLDCYPLIKCPQCSWRGKNDQAVADHKAARHDKFIVWLTAGEGQRRTP